MIKEVKGIVSNSNSHNISKKDVYVTSMISGDQGDEGTKKVNNVSLLSSGKKEEEKQSIFYSLEDDSKKAKNIRKSDLILMSSEMEENDKELQPKNSEEELIVSDNIDFEDEDKNSISWDGDEKAESK